MVNYNSVRSLCAVECYGLNVGLKVHEHKGLGRMAAVHKAVVVVGHIGFAVVGPIGPAEDKVAAAVAVHMEPGLAAGHIDLVDPVRGMGIVDVETEDTVRKAFGQVVVEEVCYIQTVVEDREMWFRTGLGWEVGRKATEEAVAEIQDEQV